MQGDAVGGGRRGRSGRGDQRRGQSAGTGTPDGDTVGGDGGTICRGTRSSTDGDDAVGGRGGRLAKTD